MKDQVIKYLKQLILLILIGVNLRGERNTENKNLKACTDVDGVHDEYSYFCSLHQMFYLSPIKFVIKKIKIIMSSNYVILC